MRGRLQHLLGHLRARAWQWIRERTLFSSVDLAGSAESNIASGPRPVLGIVLAEHVTSRAESFPPIPRRQLHKVLAARRAAGTASDERFAIGEVIDGRRWVTFYRVDANVEQSVRRALFIIPEPLLIGRSIQSNEVVVVERDPFRGFINSMGAIHRAGGLINSAQQYFLAAGLPESTSSSTLGDLETRDRAIDALGKLGRSDWLVTFNPLYRAEALAIARPAAIGVAVTLLAYLAASSAYLMAMDLWRSRRIEAIQAEVAPLLESQRDVDRLHAQRSGLVDLYGARVETWKIWEVATVIWAQGGQLRGWALSGSDVVIRGSAPSATAILGAVSALKTVKKANFDAPVRSVGDFEEFVIKFSLDSAVKRDARQ